MTYKLVDQIMLFWYNVKTSSILRKALTVKNIFLDLEATVIDNWQNGELINQDKVRIWLAKQGTTQVHIFSFAVWDAMDRTHFNHHLKEKLEQALGVKIVDVPTVNELFRSELAVTGVRWDSLHEFASIRGKVDAFRSWCRDHHPHEHNILVDDTVPTAIWKEHKSQLCLEFVNVLDI